MPRLACARQCCVLLCLCLYVCLLLPQGTYGGGLAIYSATHADLRNNIIAHNVALKIGGGMECAVYYGTTHIFTSVNNTWLNNSAVIRGGGAITHPCDMEVHGDRFLGNRAQQEGGGFMVYGGEKVVLQGVQVSCNTAQDGGGLMVKLSDSSDASHLDLRCSSVTANGGPAGPAAQQQCIDTVARAYLEVPRSRSSSTASANAVGLLAAIAATAGEAANTAADPPSAGAAGGPGAAAAAAEKGGGLYIAAEQSARIAGSALSGNRASSSGAGVYLDRKAVMAVTAAAASASTAGVSSGSKPVASFVSYNNCTGGSGGGLFMEEGTTLAAADTVWSNNQVTLGDRQPVSRAMHCQRAAKLLPRTCFQPGTCLCALPFAQMLVCAMPPGANHPLPYGTMRWWLFLCTSAAGHLLTLLLFTST